MKYYQKINKEQFINFINSHRIGDTIYFGTGVSPHCRNYEQLINEDILNDETLIEGWFGIKLLQIKELDIFMVVISRMGGGYINGVELDWKHEANLLSNRDQIKIRFLIENYWDENSEYFEDFVWVEKTTLEDK
jgi:hypothetical protein